MTEALQTRNEISRSLEDAEKFQAIRTLTEVGLLVPASEIETFHGRIGSSDDTEVWNVDASFGNASNDSGNLNVNARATLYTGDKELAKEFAIKRGNETVGAKYDKYFADKVRNYTPEERQEWFKREKRIKQDLWDSTPKEKRGFLFDPDTFSDRDLASWKEVKRLQGELTEEERNDLWAQFKGNLRGEVYEIASPDSDAMILDRGFDATSLSEEDTARYEAALGVLIRHTPATEGSPVGFNSRHSVIAITEAIQALKKGIVLNSQAAEIAEQTGADLQLVIQIAGAFNAYSIARRRPQYLANRLVRNPEDIFVDPLEVDGKQEEMSINMEYVQRYLRNAHIVGVKENVKSATLGRSIDTIYFVDLEKVNTVEALSEERTVVWQKLGAVATALDRAVEADFTDKPELLKVLTDLHAKPEKLVEAAKQVDGYGAIFEADAGNWEGYSLAEHTETVLRNFDENYADKLPAELLAPMRLAILAHDLGKPRAVAEGNKQREKRASR